MVDNLMSIERYSEEYLLSLLNEAPNDNAMGQTATMSNSDNAAYEPQEQDASMGVENTTGDMNADPGMDEMDMGGMDDGMGGSGDASMGGMDSGMGMGTGDTANVNTKDLFKKRRLFQDYKELLSATENVIEASATLIPKDLPEDAKKIFRFINRKMEENREKLNIILTEQFFNLSYQQLMTIYMYIKMATKLYTDMVKQISDLYGKED